MLMILNNIKFEIKFVDYSSYEIYFGQQYFRKRLEDGSTTG